MRAEFYREKSKDYVAAALSMGQSDFKVMFKHILPNSLVPIITYFPFSVVAGVSALVGLDYLGFGLALHIGMENGRFSMSYALGKQDKNDLLVKNAKFHFGYIQNL